MPAGCLSFGRTSTLNGAVATFQFVSLCALTSCAWQLPAWRDRSGVSQDAGFFVEFTICFLQAVRIMALKRSFNFGDQSMNLSLIFWSLRRV